MRKLAHLEAMVYSMTPEERSNPKILSPQRKYRIARGSGNSVADVNRFIKQFEQMQKMMKQMGGGKHRRNPFGMGGMGGFGFSGKGKFPY